MPDLSEHIIRADPSILDADVIGIAKSRLILSDSSEDFILPRFQQPIRVDQNHPGSNTLFVGV